MSKAVLISIRPEWCAKIASGEKTIEVRKTRPKLPTPFKCYIYCTACRSYFRATEHMAFGDDELYRDENRNIKYGSSIELMCAENYDSSYFLNQKVIGEFVCDCVLIGCEMGNADRAINEGCIREKDLLSYSAGNPLYGWHISDLKIYDTPKELREFKSWVKPFTWDFPEAITRPPQSWRYVEELT